MLVLLMILDCVLLHLTLCIYNLWEFQEVICGIPSDEIQLKILHSGIGSITTSGTALPTICLV